MWYRLWPPHAKSWLIGKDPDAGRDWGQEEKGTAEDEMAWWHHWLDGCELSEFRELVMDREAWHAAISWGCKESDTTERLNWTELQISILLKNFSVGRMKIWGNKASSEKAVKDILYILGFYSNAEYESKWIASLRRKEPDTYKAEILFWLLRW